MNYTLHFDGSITKNPGGIARYGFIIKYPDDTKISESGYIGSGPKMSCNLAEFEALAQGLATFLYEVNPTRNVMLNVYGDSQIVIGRMNTHKKPDSTLLYYGSYISAKMMDSELKLMGVKITYNWIARNNNYECDAISR